MNDGYPMVAKPGVSCKVPPPPIFPGMILLFALMVGGMADTLYLNRDRGADYQFAIPRFVEVDAQGHFYVAEMAEFAIRKYDAKGTFLTRMGGRGRGPGEFQDITSMTVFNNRIIVFDNLSWRITEFSLAGRKLREYTVDFRELHWPRNILFEADRRIVLSAGEQSPYLAHVFDADFKFQEGLIPRNRIHGRDPIATEYQLLRPGHILTVAGGVLFAPYFHSGVLYHQAYGATEPRRISGHPVTGASYTRLPENATSYSIRYGGQSGFTNLHLHHESRGLFRQGDRILHFILITERGKRVLGYEIYDRNLNFQRFVRLTERPIPRGAVVDIPWNIKAVVDRGRIVVHDYETASILVFPLPR